MGNKRFWLISLITALLLSPFISVPANAWDPQPTNPFPGVPFEGEIPGYTVEVVCPPGGDNSSSGVDFGIGIVPVVDCPPWSAADGRNGYANDGPPGDPHKKIGVARRFCRNSWTPPTTATDDEDFKNRQNLAMAAATLESQAYSASHPGEQKCVTWGPIVHANGISTASGGVCANVVGTKPDGTTAQVPPTALGTTTSSTSASDPTSTSGSSGSSTSTSSAATPALDYSQFGVGKPFTKVVAGTLTTAQCPSGYRSSSNQINAGMSEYGATECWPENAWAAYSVGGDTWTQFKTSNGSASALAEITRKVQVNILRAFALAQAQQSANETIGTKRCNSWSGYGESGQECAYIPVQSSIPLIGNPIPTAGDVSSSSVPPTDTATATVSTAPVVVSGTGTDTSTATMNSGTSATQDSLTSISKTIASKSESKSLSNLITKLINATIARYSPKVVLPSASGVEEVAISLTPQFCSVSGMNVLSIKKGSCQVAYSVTGASGKSFTTVKTFDFKR